MRNKLNVAIQSHDSVVDTLNTLTYNQLQVMFKKPQLVRLLWREVMEKMSPIAQDLAEQGFQT